MKRTNQLRVGNVTGAGNKFRGRQAPASAGFPRNLPAMREARRNKQAPFVMPMGMTGLLAVLFKRAGLATPYN